MTLADMIRRFRVLAKDAFMPYRAQDVDVTDWLNDAQAQACVRGRLIREDALPEVCRIALTPGQHTYPLHASAYEIIDLRLLPASGGRSRPMRLVSRELLNAEQPEWRDDTCPATQAIQDDTSIRVVGGFQAGDVLALECYRLPVQPMQDESEEPEIHQAHHEHLIQWALHKAFSIPDSELFDPGRAALAEEAFTAYFGPLPDSDMRRATRTDVVHHNRAILP